MRLSSAHTRLLIASLCVALLVLRVGGTHLHLCMDGSEPPVSLHVSDAAGEHHHEDVAAHPGATAAPEDPVHGFDHDDVDVSIDGDVILKKGTNLFDAGLLAIAFAIVLFVVVQNRGIAPVTHPPPRRSPVRSHLQHPPRGPPRLA